MRSLSLYETYRRNYGRESAREIENLGRVGKI